MELEKSLVQIESKLTVNFNNDLCEFFSEWTTKDYGYLYLKDLTIYPLLSKKMPKMPPENIQRHWTWFSGQEAINVGIVFSETSRHVYESITGKSIADARVLDYGAGWGRLTRMMLQFIPNNKVFACDADAKSVDLFNSLGFETQCIKVPSVPHELPFEPNFFDFVWLWSVLTHLPEEAADAVMCNLYNVVKPDGVLLVTVRPSSFWEENPLVAELSDKDALLDSHELTGFAHHHQNPYWGDTSMSFDYMKRKWPQWSIVKFEDDGGHQVRVYLTPNK